MFRASRPFYKGQLYELRELRYSTVGPLKLQYHFDARLVVEVADLNFRLVIFGNDARDKKPKT